MQLEQPMNEPAPLPEQPPRELAPEEAILDDLPEETTPEPEALPGEEAAEPPGEAEGALPRPPAAPEEEPGEEPEEEAAPEEAPGEEDPAQTLIRLQAQLEEAARRLEAQQARMLLEQQMEQIRRLDPELSSLEALARQPEFEAFDRLVRGGQDLVSAYKLAFFDRYAARSARAARQAAINGARAKGHLAAVGTGPMPEDDGLTDELIRQYRLYNPGMTRRQIARYHAQYRKENHHV